MYGAYIKQRRDEMTRKTKTPQHTPGEMFEFEGVTVQAVEAEFQYVAQGFRPAFRRKEVMFCAQRPNGTFEGMCPSPSEAVRAMRMFWERKRAA